MDIRFSNFGQDERFNRTGRSYKNKSYYNWQKKLDVALDVETLLERLGKLTIEWVVCDMLLKGCSSIEICQRLLLTEGEFKQIVGRICQTAKNIGLD